MELTAVAGPAADVSVEVQVTIRDRHGEIARHSRTLRANHGWLESPEDVRSDIQALRTLLKTGFECADFALTEVQGLH